MLNKENQHIAWMVEIIVRDDKLDAFETLTDEMVAETSREEGALIYERFIDRDSHTVLVYERYRDCDAALVHLDTFARLFNARFAPLIERRQAFVMGCPSTALRERLSILNPRFVAKLAGFARFADVR